MPPINSINLHPTSHSPSSLPSDTYDVVCIGSGWAANITSARVIKSGLTAVIIESELFGGDCPFWACVPSKALLRPGEVFDEAKAVGGAKERLDVDKGLDVEGVFRRRDGWTFDWHDDQFIIPTYEGAGTHLVRGHGEITGIKTVSVKNSTGESTTLHARQAVVVCSGSEAVIPNVPGLAESNPWGPREATSASTVPKHIVILGAGAVGCEMTSAFTQFGSKVTLVSPADEILPRYDSEAGAIVRQKFVSEGVDVRVSARVTEVRRDAADSLTVKLTDGSSVSASHILVAAGRRSRTKGMGLEQFGLKTDGTPLPVDESLCISSVPGNWLYAAGDVNGRALLSHTSKYHGRIVSNAIVRRKNSSNPSLDEWGRYAATADRYAIPQVVFSHPNVASVGLTRKAAKIAGKTIKEVTAPVKTEGAELRANGYEDGWAQWIVDADSDTLLGATFVGDNVAELLHASTVAIVGGMRLDRLAHAIPSFPTMSEVYLNLLEAAGF